MRGRVLIIGLALGLALATTARADSASLSERDVQTYRAAFRAAHAGRWPEARSLAAQAHDKLLAKTLLWFRLLRPGSDAGFEDIADFVTHSPDWPSDKILRERAEDTMADNVSPRRVKEWFAANPPVTTTGKIRNAEALLALGEQQDGLALLRKTWIEGNFGERQELIFLFKHHQQLRPQDNLARLDRLLWDGQAHAARETARRVDRGHAALAEARIKLMGMEPGVELALRRVPAELQNDPGLLYERARWRRRKDMDEEARAILMHPPADLVRPELWWQERAIEARRAIAQGYVTEAQHLTEHHDLTPGTVSYADAEWLAGWISLRLLREPSQAFRHFQQMADAVRYPISRSRAEYWEGRALAAMGKANEASDTYTEAAHYGMTYYGQLAALKLDPSSRPVLPPSPQPSTAQREAFNNQELVRVVRELGQIGEDDLKELFIKRLAAHPDSPEIAVLVADLAVEETRPDLAVRLARQTWHGEVPLAVHGYPIRTLPASVSAENALVLSVIRQESAFDVRAVSRAGALGLMQLMPATAKKTASGLGLGFTPTRLTDDPDFNVRVGGTYLSKLLDDFGGSYVLAIAAYNAGPGRVRQWMRESGDPRTPDVDVIDWIEMIPYEETRNYVQRVLEALHIYRERLAGSRVGLNLERDMGGSASTPQ